jgi:hypothetical protein
MSLQGSTTELQNKIVELYLDLHKRFTENTLIRDLWGTMADDISQQTHSLKALPVAFWHQIKGEEERISEAISQHGRHQIIENKDNNSLRSCFERALLIEESTILKVYVPIIRSLRKSWTDKSLDFYIMVKAHVARMVRVTEAFSGDPVIIQRAHQLLKSFEKEIQEPEIAISIIYKSHNKAHVQQPDRDKKNAVKPAKDLKPANSRTKHANTRHNRTKPLVEKINLPRRRAQR